MSAPAAPLRRYAALVYDLLLVLAVTFGTGAAYLAAVVALTDADGAIAPDSPLSYGLRAALVLAWFAYFGGFWRRAGFTPGMRAWKLKVERLDGTTLTWKDAAVRCLGAVLSALPAGLGYWWALVDPEKRAWHDRLSRTRLVLDESLTARDA